jgi:hypothetical protein
MLASMRGGSVATARLFFVVVRGRSMAAADGAADAVGG